MKAKWTSLLTVERAGIIEREIFGAIAFSSKPALADPLIFGRSLMKPYQMKAIAGVLSEMSWEEKAIALSSHNGTALHVSVAQRILGQENWRFLLLPAAQPLAPRPEPVEKTQWLNCCSGKHAAIVRACQIQGWPLATYLQAGHPYDLAFRSHIEKELRIQLNGRAVAADGCALPTYALKVSELARLFAALAKNRAGDWIWEASHRHPELIGGQGRLDTKILANFPTVFAKEGADGLLGLALVDDRFPQGLGVVIKLAHGHDPVLMWRIAHKILADLDLRFEPPAELAGQEVVWNEDVIVPL